MSWLAVQLRRLADARVATAGLMGLALITSFLFAVAPRIIDAEADHALHSTVAAASADTRNISVSQSGRLAAGVPDSMAVVSAGGDQFDQQFPSSVAALVAARYIAVDTARFRPIGIEARTVRLRYLEGASDRIRLVSGRLPTGRTTDLPLPPDSTIRNGSTAMNRPLPLPTSLTTFEVALSVASAANLGVGIDDTVALRTDETDKLAGWSVAIVAVKIVGIFEVTDESADYWFADTSLERPQVRSISSTNQIDDITVLMAPEAYPSLLGATEESRLPFRYTWRHQIDATRLRADGIGPLLTDLRRLESVFLAASAGAGNSWLSGIGKAGPPSLQSGLLRLVRDYAAGWRSVSEILSIAEVGGCAVALLALSLVCLLAGRRRAGSLALWQSRGASRLHVLGAALVEVALELALPGAAGAALAVALVPGRAPGPSFAAAGAVLAFAAALVFQNALAGARDLTAAAAAVGGGNGRGTEGGRGLAALARGAGPRRLVLEAVVVVVAVVGAYVLRQRGVAAAGSDTVLASPDPFVAAVPALIGGAAALLVARLLPLPLDVLARLAGRGRGLVALLALHRATRRTNDRLLLTTLLTMAAVWSFAAASLAYLDRASDAASWQSVGASFRISLREGSLPPDFDIAALPGVDAVSGAAVLIGHVPEKNALLSVLALDLAAYGDVVKGGWLDGIVPQSMIDAEARAPAARPAAIPAIVSTAFAHDNGLKVGDGFELAVNNARPAFTVTAVRDTFPTLDADSRWVVVARNNLAAGTGIAIAPTEAFIRAGPGAAPTIARALQDRLPAQGAVTSRFDAGDGLRSAPEFVAVVFGLAAASLVTAFYGALAIFAALLLAGAEQSRESAHLRVLGLSRAQNLGLSAMEHGPASILVIVAGIALGGGLFMFLQSGLGLGQLVGGDIDVGLPIEGLQVAAIFGAIGAIVGVAVGLETLAESIIKPTAALRRGMD